MGEYDHRILVKRCLEGESRAWNEFVDRFSGLACWAIRRKLLRYGSFDDDLKDIFQGLFASIWEKKRLSTVKERRNISPWMVVVASNAAMDYLKRKRHEHDAIRTYRNERSRTTGKRRALSGKKVCLIDEAISRLNEKERFYFELFYKAGKRHREIADTVRAPVNTVSTVINRAKQKVKSYVEKNDRKQEK